MSALIVHETVCVRKDERMAGGCYLVQGLVCITFVLLVKLHLAAGYVIQKVQVASTF